MRASFEPTPAAEIDRILVVESDEVIRSALQFILNDAGEGIHRPFLAFDADDVRVGGEENGALRAIPLQSSDEMRFPGLRCGDDINLESKCLEPRREQLGYRSFIARRVGCVDPNQVDE